MSYGPVEVLEVVFPGNRFRGEIIPALQELVASNTIRILDLAVISKDASGDLLALEIADLDPAAAQPLLALVDGEQGLFSDEDFTAFGEGLQPNSTAALLLFENTWATRFATAIRNANGQVVLNERIPRAVIEELAAAVA
jgi:hypothetical protein